MQAYSFYLEKTGEFGEVREVRHHVAVAYGLPKARIKEVVVFESGQLGEVFAVDREFVEVLVYSKTPVRVGTKLARTGEIIRVPVGEELLGKVLNPLGSPIAGVLGFVKPLEEREVDLEAPGISTRYRIKRPLMTGVSLVDVCIPLGMGQRELVLGDRKTGKSSFLMNTIKNQVSSGSVAVYCAIGRKRSDIKRIDEYLRKENISQNTVIIASSYDDPASLIYLSPYTAMTIAEYFRDKGRDVLLVLDDLSTHAKFYREISLLSKRFPGRDSYPGDIFYSHARLLERAGSFKHPERGEVAITCLPVAETVEDDLGYIVTNLMGMTDGHVFFDSNLYYKGRRPAINIALSVTRVGRQAQSSLRREINHEINAFLASFERVQSLSSFGADLSENVKQVIDTGNKIFKFFDQDYSDVISSEVQLLVLSLIWMKYFYGKDEEVVNSVRRAVVDATKNPEVISLIKQTTDVNNFNDLLANVSKNRNTLFSLCKIEM